MLNCLLGPPFNPRHSFIIEILVINNTLSYFLTWHENTYLGRPLVILLQMWSVMSMLLVFAFSCNLRAIYLKPSYEAPLDNSEQVVKSSKVILFSVHIQNSSFSLKIYFLKIKHFLILILAMAYTRGNLSSNPLTKNFGPWVLKRY